MLNINIVIIRSDAAVPTVIETEQPIEITVFLGYEVGFHYQSLIYNQQYGKQYRLNDFTQDKNQNNSIKKI